MAPQFDLFDGVGDAREATPELPEGFRYRPELIGRAEEDSLLARVRGLPFREFEFHGYIGRRRVVSFGCAATGESVGLSKIEDSDPN